MIIKFENGRLGNQLFQYCGIKQYFPRHKIVFFGFSQIKNLLNIFDVFFINTNESLFYKLLKKFIFFLSYIKIIGKITETSQKNIFRIKVCRGVLWNIFLAQDIYFQHERFIKKITFIPPLKYKNIERAEQWIKKKNNLYKEYNLVFVHIRRGDYLTWPDIYCPAALDIDWYKKNIERVKNEIDKPLFIIIGDDFNFLKNSFKESDELIISENSYELDLTIMALCSHGILSASSFAWWGAFYAKINGKDNSIFLAPKYWVGHKIKKWIPINFYTNWITYI